MPRGMQGVKDASADAQARREAAQSGPRALYFKLGDGESTIVRFLEQDDDVAYCYMHEIPVEGRNFGRMVACCDQDKEGIPCPGCDRDMKLKFKGYINVIWDDAPVLKRDQEGKVLRDNDGKVIITGTKSQAAVWNTGLQVFEQLDKINTNYRGLTSRRFKVERTGAKLDTKYFITPEDPDSGPGAMSAAEKKIAAEKADLDEFTRALTFDEFMKELGEGGGQSGGDSGSNGEEAPVKRNPFMKRK
jgi:hypothetical protein